MYQKILIFNEENDEKAFNFFSSDSNIPDIGKMIIMVLFKYFMNKCMYQCYF